MIHGSYINIWEYSSAFTLLLLLLLLLSAIFSYFLHILILKICLVLLIFKKKAPNIFTNFDVCYCGRSELSENYLS